MGYIEENAEDIEAEAAGTIREIMRDPRALTSDRLAAAKDLLGYVASKRKTVSIESNVAQNFVVVSAVSQARELLAGGLALNPAHVQAAVFAPLALTEGGE